MMLKWRILTSRAQFILRKKWYEKKENNKKKNENEKLEKSLKTKIKFLILDFTY